MYYFDKNKKEIEINQYNTPTPWMNYLSNGEFHVMISQAGGGVAFYKSPQIWRINHYRFFNVPTDRSGFYTYIIDGEDYWCPTNEPCKTKPQIWKATHGMGYTRYEAERTGVHTQVTYFVSPLENVMIWNMKIKSEQDKEITIMPYVELGMMEYLREQQWQCYNKHQLSCYNREDILIYKYGVEMQPKENETPLVFFAADSDITGYDCDRDEFLGSYRSEENPQNVEQKKCSNSVMFGGDPCFALEIKLQLEGGKERELNIFLGTAMSEVEISEKVNICREKDFVKKSYELLIDQWDLYFNHFQCEIPDKDAEVMINTWNPYQVHRNFMFSRNISYYATGTFRGVGIRDTAQDILAMIPFDVKAAKEKIKLLLTQQYKDGHTNHYCFPLEGWEPVKRIHSDNHLWLIMACYHIVMEEGNLSFLDEDVEFYDGESASVWHHMKKSIDFCCENLGEHGFPLMLSSDWNDMLYKVCRKGKGESIWTSMQFGTVLIEMITLAKLRGEEYTIYQKLYEKQKTLVNALGWDGKWFRRCITDEGKIIGTEKEPQAKIWLNTQSWSVISQMGDKEKQIEAMNQVGRLLDTEYGIKKIDPAMTDYPSSQDPLTYYNKGCGENGSIFCHANTWAIIAECILERPKNAYKYYHQLLPPVVQKRVGSWRYKAEPYVYSSNIFGPESDKFGLANVSWLTGTAAWMYIAVTQYMFGIKPEWNGLRIKPCLSEEMLPAKIVRKFRGCEYHITITDTKRDVFVEHVDGRKQCWVEL